MDSRRKAMLLPAGMAVAHALLFLLSYWLLTSVPGPRAPDEEIAAFYRSGDQLHLVLAGFYVMPFAGIAFLWFASALRSRLRFGAQAADEVVARVQLASGVLYVALFFAAAAANSVTAVAAEHSRAEIEPMIARLFPEYGRTLLLGFAMRMAAMFVFTTSRLVRVTGMLPRWFAGVGLLAGLFLLLSPTWNRALVLVFPGWLILLAVLLVASAGRSSGSHGSPGASAPAR